MAGKVSGVGGGRGKRGGSEPRLIGLERDQIRDTKKRLMAAIHKHGSAWVEKILEAGPRRLVGEGLRDPIVATTNKDDAALAAQMFEWAMVFAGDRGGLHKQTGIEVGGQDGIPPIKVEIVGHARPSDT